MSDEKTGLEKAREKRDELAAEVQAEADAKEKSKQAAISQLAVISGNPELAKMYQENAQVGAANLGGELPLLKIHAVGRSTKNVLADGTEPKDGAFFYKPTGEQFDSVDVHLLTISKGFRAKGMEGSDRDDVFNQVVAGCIVEGTDYKLFFMYFTGLKLANLWSFGKEAAKYTHAKPVPLPMFALKVRFTTEKIDNSYGKSWIVKFEILKGEGDFPEIVIDPGEFQFLKGMVDEAETTIASIISRKASMEVAEAQPIQGEAVVEGNSGVKPEEIPF